MGTETLDEQCPFQTKEKLFGLDAGTITDKTIVAADDTMTRNHDGQGVCTIRAANSLKCTRDSDTFRQIFVRNGSPVPDPPKLRPHFLLETCAYWIKPAVESHQFAVKIPVELVYDLFVLRYHFCNFRTVTVSLNPAEQLLLALGGNTNLADPPI